MSAFLPALEACPDGYLHLDGTLRIRYVNAAAAALLGVTREALLGAPAGAAFLPELIEPVSTFLAAALESPQPLTFNAPDPLRSAWRELTAVRGGDGVGIWLHDQTASQAARLELEERRAVERELREIGELNRGFLQASQDCIKILDLDARLLFMSQAGRTIMGIEDFGSIAGRVWVDFWTGRDHEAAVAAVDAARSGGVGRFEGRVHTTAGELHWFDSIVTPILGPDGKPHRLLAVSRDITERQALEEKMREVQRMESVGLLAGGIAHDFNNILTIIMGNAGMLARALPRSSAEAARASAIVTGAERAAHLTRQLLAYAGKGPRNLERLDLSELVRHAQLLLRASVPATIELELDLDSRMPPIHADSAQLSQVLTNLLLNAVEAIGNRPGRIRLVTFSIPNCVPASESPAAQPYTALPGAYACLEVADTGCGMDAATQAHIFDPFFTTKFTGRGLGLPAVQGIIRTHKGHLRVWSKPGEGTTVRVCLPAAQAEHPREVAAPHAQQSGAANRATVLVVDDEVAVRGVAAGILSLDELTILEAGNGREALDILAEHPEVRLVLLDVTMPVLSGAPTLKEIRRLYPQLPVLITSGYAEQAVSNSPDFEGAAGFVPKPYSLEQLSEKVRSCLERGGSAKVGRPV